MQTAPSGHRQYVVQNVTVCVRVVGVLTVGLGYVKRSDIACSAFNSPSTSLQYLNHV